MIISLIEAGSRVLDLGCGEGDLLLALKALKEVRAEGIELSEACIQACVAAACSVFSMAIWTKDWRITRTSPWTT